jgi:hypothetical protein
MDELKKLYDVLTRDGYYTKSFDDFQVQFSDPVYVQKVYDVVNRDGLFTNDIEVFKEKYSVKKKDDSQPELVSESEVGLSEEQPKFKPIPTGGITSFEKDTAIERTLGKNFVTDFFGDIYRAAEQGVKQGAAVDDALKIFGKGTNVTSENVQAFIEAQNALADTPESDEMRKFNADFDEAGGGVFGFIKALLQNRGQVIPQLFVSSVTAMMNPASLAAAGGTIAAGTGAGAAAGAPVGGVGAIPGAIGGFISSLPFALGASGGTLETALSFGEFLQEEVTNNGKEFTEEAVMEVINDPEAMTRIRSKAAGRGLTIGIIDRYTSGIAGKVVKGMGSAAKGATVLKRAGQDAKRLVAAGGIESVGGSLGETAARVVAGQELDVKEIGFEGIAGTATAPFSFAYGQLLGQPKYDINEGVVSRQKMEEAIKNYSDKDFAKAEIKIENDPELLALAKKRKDDLKIRDQVILEGQATLPQLPKNIREKVIELEIESKKLLGNRDKGSQLRLEEINKELNSLYEVDTEVTKEVPSKSEEIREKLDITKEQRKPDVTEANLDEETVEEQESLTIEEQIQRRVEDTGRQIEGKPPAKRFKKRGEEVSVAVDNQITKVIENTNSENIIEQKETIFKSIAKPLNTSEARKKAFLDLVDKLSQNTDVSKRTIARLKTGIQKSTFDNAGKVRNKLEDVIKTFDTQERKDLYKEGNSLVEKIKRQIRKGRKRLDDNLIIAAEEFLDINPLEVSGLKEYVDKANQITEGLKPTRLTKKGADVSSPFVINDITEYTQKELEIEKIKVAQLKQDAFQELTGVSAEELSMNEVNEVLRNAYNESVTSPDEFIVNEISKITGKEQIINTAAANAFDTYKTIIKNQIDTGVDTFSESGRKIELTPRQKRIVKDFMEIDVTKLSTPDKVKAIDAIVNFAVNGESGGMLATTSKYKGGEFAALDESNNLRSSEIKNVVDKMLGTSSGLYWSKNIASLPIMSEFMFGNQNDSRTFFENSGLQKVINGSANGERISTAIGDMYHAKFYDKKANGEDFYSPENVTERGMYGFINRTIDGTVSEQQEEFQRRKDLIEESYEALKNGSPIEQQKGQDYENVFNKILKEAVTIQDVKDKVDAVNVEAVDFIINEWSEIYPDLKNHALDIYNVSLDSDPNYVSDTLSLLEGVDAPSLDAPIFDNPNLNKRKIYNKKTGVLEKNLRLQSLQQTGKKRYVNLDFDSQQIFKIRKALIDMDTAEGIQQLKGYTDSKAFEQIIPDPRVREEFLNRIKEYVNAKRGNKYISEKSRRDARKLNRFITLGVSRTLGSVGQYPKQLVPLSNTAVNAGGKNTFDAVRQFTSNKALREWITKLPYDIANRGIEAEALLDSYNTKLEKQARTKSGKMVGELDKLQNWWLKQMLINPDKIAANASWVAYYGREMKRKGVDIFAEGFDWANHEVDTEAGNYAQQQVDRQQNVSQRDLQGAWFRSDDTTTRLMTKIFLPFSNFLLNQKSRMYSDLNTMTNKNSSTQERTTAARSLGGLAVETAVFNAIGLGLTMGTAALSNMLGAPEEDPEKLEQQTANRLKGRLGNIVSDVLSPLPPLDDGVRIGLNALIASISDDENPFEFYTSNETLLEDLGLGSIVIEKSIEQPFVALKTMLSGTYNGKELDSEHLELAKVTAALWPLYISGALPAEAGSIITYNLKRIKDSVK